MPAATWTPTRTSDVPELAGAGACKDSECAASGEDETPNTAASEMDSNAVARFRRRTILCDVNAIISIWKSELEAALSAAVAGHAGGGDVTRTHLKATICAASTVTRNAVAYG